MLTVKEAQTIINLQAKNFGSILVSILAAQGRVLAEDIYADRDYPPFHRAAMDGYALKIEDFESGIREFTIVEEIYAGSLSTKKLSSGDCYKIMTGASTPEEADTIIRVEDTTQHSNKVIFKIDELKKGQNIAKRGEDKQSGALVLKKETRLRATELATLAVLGKVEVNVYKIPTVSIISTGNEIVSIEQTVASHQIRESNSYALDGFLKNYNIPVCNKKLVRDDKELLTEAISSLMDSDILILSGGVSMGDADFVPEVLSELGVERLFHKVAIKPGKPLWFGKTKKGVVFALPGNPVSVQVAFKIFIEPYLRKCFGLPEVQYLRLPLGVGRKKKVKFDEYFPCRIETNKISSVLPIKMNGSGDVTSALYSDGIALQEKEELREGDVVWFCYW